MLTPKSLSSWQSSYFAKNITVSGFNVDYYSYSSAATTNIMWFAISQ